MTIALFSRRTALLLAATSLAGLGGAACSERRREAWESGPRTRNGHPVLRMPFPAGTLVLCQQGNLSPQGRTHFKENCRYALDFSNTSVAGLTAVAAAPGRVAYVYGASAKDDPQAGFGFGNHVKIEHGGGYFTMYAHLDEVLVKEGDVLGAAARIGTVGFTGAAGNRHLHFSLHQGSPAGMGVYESIPMAALVTMEPSWPDGFRSVASTDLGDGGTDIWGGSLYGSENEAGRAPLSGSAPPALAAMLASSRDRLSQAVHDRSDLDAVSRGWEQRGAEWARALVAPILGRDPRHAVARYWLATAVDMATGKLAEAESALRDLLITGPAEPTWEPWLVSWIDNRLGAMALKKGDEGAARALFFEAAKRATAQPERDFAVTALRGMGVR